LQHYRLHRDCEVAVIDGSRQLGNGYLLPAGPLREPASRLNEADLVLVNQRDASASNSLSPIRTDFSFRVELRGLRSLKTNELRSLQSLSGQLVHVVTGIGNPDSFLNALKAYGIQAVARVLPDHAAIRLGDLQFDDALPVLMTAKDAVKCAKLHVDERYWVVDADAVLDDIATHKLIAGIEARIKNCRSES
jgi:tetraacyldisaccharide 4'-kinase